MTRWLLLPVHLALWVLFWALAITCYAACLAHDTLTQGDPR